MNSTNNPCTIQIQHDEYMEYIMRCAHEAGFREVSMGFGSSKVFHSDGWEAEIERINDLLSKYDLRCIQTHMPYYHPLISAEEIDPTMETALSRCLTATMMLGAKYCSCHPRSAVNDNFDEKKSLEYSRLSLDKLAVEAGQNKVYLCLENLMIYPQWRLYPNSAEALAELIDCYDSEYVGATWDFGHAHMTKLDEPKAIKTLGKRLYTTHIHDNAQDDDSHLPPYDGTTDWETDMNTLRSIGYAGPLTMEVVYPTDEGAVEFMKKCYDRCDRLRKILHGEKQ